MPPTLRSNTIPFHVALVSRGVSWGDCSDGAAKAMTSTCQSEERDLGGLAVKADPKENAISKHQLMCCFDIL